jgi:hypothetical protein
MTRAENRTTYPSAWRLCFIVEMTDAHPHLARPLPVVGSAGVAGLAMAPRQRRWTDFRWLDALFPQQPRQQQHARRPREHHSKKDSLHRRHRLRLVTIVIRDLRSLRSI